MTSTTVTRSPDTARVLSATAWVVFALGMVKFSALAVEHGLAQAPWGLLIVLIAPFAAGAALIGSRRRAGAAVIGLWSAALVAVLAVGVVQGLEPYWADWLLLLVGGPLALIAVGLSGRLLARR